MSSFSKLRWLKTPTADAALTNSEFRVLVAVFNFTDKRGRNAYPGNDRLADACCTSRRHVRRALRSLEAKGWLRRVEYGGYDDAGRRRATVYELVDKAPSDPEVMSTNSDFTTGHGGAPLSAQGGPH